MDARNSSGLKQATFPVAGVDKHRLAIKVYSAIPHPVRIILGNSLETFIAGGFIRDAAVGVPYNDIDLYLGGAKISLAGRYLQSKGATVVSATQHGLTFSLPIIAQPNTDDTAILWDSCKVQLLYSGNKLDTLAAFDLDCCRAAYTSPGGLHASTKFTDCVTSGIASYSTDKFGPGTYRRLERLRMQGWTIPPELYNVAVERWDGHTYPSGGA